MTMKIPLAWSLLASMLLSASGQCPAFMWSDEFDGTSLNTSNWEYQIGDGCDLGTDFCGWGNQELQYYLEENVEVSNGTLKIVAKQEAYGEKPYTSARIRSLGKVDLDLTQEHLRLEARIQVPAGKGLLSAFWMLPSLLDVNPWPQDGEIDIMEFIGREPNNAHGYLHYGDLWNDRAIKGGPIRTPDSPSDDFHVYAIEKTPNQIRFFFDGHLFQNYTNDDIEPKFSWPFESTFHFILNLAVGGNWTESPDNTTIFPTTLQVDYIRVYDFSSASFGHITGKRLLHVNQGGELYCIEDGITYDSLNWTVPDGASFNETSSTCITVDFGTLSGYVQAVAESACDTQTFRVPVEVQPFYEKEFSFVGPDSGTDNATLINSTGSYSVESFDGQPVVSYVRNIKKVYDNIKFETTAISDPELYTSEDKKFYMNVSSLTAAPCTRVFIQLEDGSTARDNNYPIGRHSRFIAFMNGTTGWQRLEFDFYDRPELNVTNVDRIVVLFDSFVQRADQYYFRNLDSATTGCIENCEALSTNQCRTSTKSEAGACTDGINNDGFGYDGDGPIDCEDSDCWDDPACSTPVPTLGTFSPTPSPTTPDTAAPSESLSPSVFLLSDSDTSSPTVEGIFSDSGASVLSGHSLMLSIVLVALQLFA